VQKATLVNKKEKSAFKILLNKKDPLDEQILKLVKNGDLKIGVVQVEEGEKSSYEDYSHKRLIHQGRHTS
jgi:hypothetical protein